MDSYIDWNPEVCDLNGERCQGGPGGTYVSEPRDAARCYYFDNVRLSSP